MSTKKQDLAQELVEFLLKEDERKKAMAEGKAGNDKEKTKPQLVKTAAESPTVGATGAAGKTDLQATVALGHLQDNPFEFDVAIPEKKTAERPRLLDKLEIKTPPQEQPANPVPSTRSQMIVNEVAHLMAGTEAVKVAQARIKTLETEKDQIRTEMEQLVLASESLQRRVNELRSQHESLERKHKEKVEILEDEKSVLKSRLQAKEDELAKVKRENEDLQARFQIDLRKIKMRERELEHRHEIIRAEMVTVVSSKDDAILELKRELETLHYELESFRNKTSEMNSKINEFHDRNHRTVKALRLALSVLETGDKKKDGE